MGIISALRRAGVLSFFILACAFAQNPTATIVGIVRDATGAFGSGRGSSDPQRRDERRPRDQIRGRGGIHDSEPGSGAV